MLKGTGVLSRCCSLQSTSGPPEQRKTRRLHGLQLPLHPQQLAGWLVILILGISTFLAVLPPLSPQLRLPLTIVESLCLAIHLVSHGFALVIDPSDPLVRRQPSTTVVPEFDRTKHLHVIENGRCHLCNITITSKRTKHCSVCNKCVRHFDHHCMWLNNCVGRRNYGYFIVCLISAIAFTLVVVGLSLTEVLATLDSDRNSTMNSTIPIVSVQPIQNTSTLVIISIVGVLSAIAAALLIHLCIFHGYIAYLGLTTYEYVRNKREQRALMQESAKLQRKNSTYHFCENAAELSEERTPREENQVYICSTRTTQTDVKCGQTREKRNFHLYFTYETQEDATSFELSSQSVARGQEVAEVPKPELKPLTPSPVSCCFSIISHHGWSERRKKKNRSESEEKVPARCTTVRRIQTFLRSRLRKNSRQRSLEATRPRRNRIGPMLMPSVTAEEAKNPPAEPDNKAPPVETVTAAIRNDPAVQLRPIKLPPLNLPPLEPISDVIHENAVLALPVGKRSQQLRIRSRPSFHRRPRFKMSPHVTQSAQLSPIPESEFSKPASPRSPPKLKSFQFPPTSTD